MKKINIEFKTPKSQKSKLYNTLKSKFGNDIWSFSGYVDENENPQGECYVDFIDIFGEYSEILANFYQGNLSGSAVLQLHLDNDEENTSNETKAEKIHFNFITDKYGEINYQDGTKYFGEISQIYPNGCGRVIEDNGDFSIGFFNQGALHGLLLSYDKNSNLVYKSVYYNGECIISSDNDDEIIKALNDCGFNYVAFVKQLSNKNITKNQINSENLVDAINEIEKNIIGQKNAVKMINNHLLLSMLYARQENKPITSMVFTGPTGVGKTEMAKQISTNVFKKKPFTIDYANFHNRFMLSSLIGSPDGYIGSDKETEFMKYIRENAETGGVLLFEEIDKAHEDCLNFFMRILDEGEVLDAHNKAHSVKNFIILATTNMSANTPRSLGFSNKDDDVKNQMANTAYTGMKKEQLARFGLVVEFKSFNKEEKRQLTLSVLEKSVERVKSIKDYNIKISFEDKFVDDLVSKINDTFGVRDIQSRASNAINENLANFIRNNDAKNISVKFHSLDDVEIKEIKPKKKDCDELTK